MIATYMLIVKVNMQPVNAMDRDAQIQHVKNLLTGCDLPDLDADNTIIHYDITTVELTNVEGL